MISCASGSIQVVTKVARLRSGIPSRTISSAISRFAASGSMPSSGISLSGAPSISHLPPRRCRHLVDIRFVSSIPASLSNRSQPYS